MPKLLSTAYSRLRIALHQHKRFACSTQLLPAPGAHPTVNWIYHSENWTRIPLRHEQRRLLRAGGSLTLLDNFETPDASVRIHKNGSISASLPPGPDRWLYLYLRPEEHLWRDFSWKFTARRDSPFRELQFGFRYRDFYNRYRFRHENGFVWFDKVLNGRFRNGLFGARFDMQLGRDYKFEIQTTGFFSSLFIDGSCILRAFDPAGSFPQGSIAVILWEDDGATPISASVSDHSVQALQRITS